MNATICNHSIWTRVDKLLNCQDHHWKTTVGSMFLKFIDLFFCFCFFFLNSSYIFLRNVLDFHEILHQAFFLL